MLARNVRWVGMGLEAEMCDSLLPTVVPMVAAPIRAAAASVETTIQVLVNLVAADQRPTTTLRLSIVAAEALLTTANREAEAEDIRAAVEANTPGVGVEAVIPEAAGIQAVAAAIGIKS